MKRYILIALLAFPFWMTAQSFKGKPTGTEKIESSNLSFEEKILKLVNQERKRRGRKPLIWDDQLAYAARYHAKDMAVDNYFDHPSMDLKSNKQHKTICDVFERMDQFLTQKIFSRAENIAVGSVTPEEVMSDWMSSRGHRRNILDKEAKYIGVGYIEMENSEWGTYWVQSFGM